MTTTLRWPDHRGRFIDHDASRAAGVIGYSNGDGRLVVAGGDTIDVSDPNTIDHYTSRGFEVVDDDDDADGDSDGADGSDAAEDAETVDAWLSDDGEFDVGGFLNRTPVADVADDIAAGDVDGHLDVVEAEASRTTVTDAVEDRREETGGA